MLGSQAMTSYAPPIIIQYNGTGSRHASTLGNQEVFIEGRNFGPKNISGMGLRPSLNS